MQNNATAVNIFTAIARCISGRCPKCGEGKLLASYIKPVETCAACGETLGNIRADDGPPWLTVLIVGHIMLPLIFTVGPHTEWPQWVSMTVWLSLATLLMGVILPKAKGVFIAIIWKNRQAAA